MKVPVFFLTISFFTAFSALGQSSSPESHYPLAPGVVVTSMNPDNMSKSETSENHRMMEGAVNMKEERKKDSQLADDKKKASVKLKQSPNTTK